MVASKIHPLTEKRIKTAKNVNGVDPVVSKVALGAAGRRPTYEAAPILRNLTWLNSMSARMPQRTRATLEMLRQIRDFNPDVSKAVDNFVTLANPGYNIQVYFAKSEQDSTAPTLDLEGLRLIEQFATRIFGEYTGSFDMIGGSEKTNGYAGLNALIDMANLMVVTYGGFSLEVELNESLDDIVDVYPVDPSLIDFQIDPDTYRLVPGLKIQNAFTPLDQTRFRYVGKDPDVNQPGGRSPLLAVVDTVLFQQQFMRELQATIHMNNTPRMDISLLQESIANSIAVARPDLMLPGQENARAAYIQGMLADIQVTASELEPDDAFVHLDSVVTNYINPGTTSVSVDSVMAAIDKMIISATKQLPLLLGRNEGSTSTHASVQWQVFILNLRGIQRVSRALATWVLNLYLRIQGRNSYVSFEFEGHKTSDDLLTAQALDVNLNAYGIAVDRGWITDNEAAMSLFNHEANGVKLAPPPVQPAEPMPLSPPRIMQDRGVSDSVDQYPAWLQQINYDTLRVYRQWRANAITPKYDIIERNTTAITDTDSLYEHLKLTDTDQRSLNSILTRNGIHIAESTITEQIRAIGLKTTAKVTDPELLSILARNASENAKSIIDTYNTELRAAIGGFDESRGVISDLLDLLKRIIHWEDLRNQWKESQISLSETGQAVMESVNQFFTRNEVTGQAEIYPYTSTRDVCADYIKKNPYPDVKTALAQTNLPAHSNCPHIVRLVSTGQLQSDSLWSGN